MTQPTPLSVPSRPARPKPVEKAAQATLEKAIARARLYGVAVDDFFYSPLVRTDGLRYTDDELMAELARQCIGTGLRLDYIVGDLARLTRTGSRF